MQRVLSIIGITLSLAVSITAAQTDSAEIETRNQRTWAISAEIGMNSLSSLIGPVATYYAMPALALDFGTGLSSSGLRPGLRGRYLFTSSEKSSFFGGAGLKYGLGSNDQEIKVEDPDTKQELRIITNGAAFLDVMLGVEFLANNGFLVIANAGYSWLLTDDPYEVVSGTLSDKGKKAFDTVFGSGIMLSVSLGKAF